MASKKLQNFLYFLLVITVIIIDITLFVVIYYRKPSSAIFSFQLTEKETEFVDRVKRALFDDNTVQPADIKIADEYNFDHGQLPHPEFNNWDKDEPMLSNLCRFGYAMMKSSYFHNKIAHCEIAEDIIIRIDRALAEKSFLRIEGCTAYGKVNPNHPKKEKYPWGTNWYAFSVHLPRLLLIYEFLGTDEYLKAFVCHRNMCRLITAIDTSLEIKRDGVNIVYFALPRILSNFLFDRPVYDTEIMSPEFQTMCDVFAMNINDPRELKNGLYEDMGYIYHQSVATYSYLFSLDRFYENLFNTFGKLNNLPNVIVPMLNKLQHPTIPYITFGLYGRDNGRIRQHWWGQKGRLGIDLIPSTGICLFKHDRFMFSLRVQKEKIACYEADSAAKTKYALGWMQLRKIYLKDVNYSAKIDANTLKNEPGILSIENVNYPLFSSYDKNANAQQFYCKNVDSYVGRLIDTELMFWKNKYQFDEAYKTTVIETGVATENGVEINYIIDNTNEKKNLKFRFKDPDVGDDQLKCFIVDEANEDIAGVDGFYVIPKNVKKSFTLRMVFDDSAANRIYIPTQENMNTQFHVNSVTYRVIYQKTRPDKEFGSYFIVQKFNSLGEIVDIIGGSTTSQLKDRLRETFDGRNITLIRDSRTTMYVKNPHL